MQKYSSRKFEGLNYSLGNEDCRVEANTLGDDAGHALCVAIGGAQLVPFLARRPKALTFVDVSQAQLSFAQLRLELLLRLSFADYLQFWGYPPYDAQAFTKQRREIAAACRLPKDLIAVFARHGWQSPLYIGKWERTAVALSSVSRAILGSKALELFECETLDAQREFVAKHFPRRRWEAIRLLTASLAATAAYFRPSEFPPGVTSGQFFREYQRIFAELLDTSLAKDNFFLQILLLGKISSPTANPPEAQRDVYAKAKQWASRCDIRFVNADAIAYLRDERVAADFVALSNISSYFVGHLQANYLQVIKPSLNSGARVLARNFLHQAQTLKLAGFEDLTKAARPMLNEECTRVYAMSLFRRRS